MGVAICSALIPSSVGAQSATASATEGVVERCRSPQHRQFDFWIGRWEVRNTVGGLIGHNEIRRVSGGCALHEDWRGVRGGRGMSISTYDVDRNGWTQRWVGVGATLWLEGGIAAGREDTTESEAGDGAMVLTSASARTTPRGEVLDRISWTPLPDGRVRQVWQISSDAGETWSTSFVGVYSPDVP